MSQKKRKKKAAAKRTRGKNGARPKFGCEKPAERRFEESYENPYGEQPARRHTSEELAEILCDPSEDIE